MNFIPFQTITTIANTSATILTNSHRRTHDRRSHGKKSHGGTWCRRPTGSESSPCTEDRQDWWILVDRNPQMRKWPAMPETGLGRWSRVATDGPDWPGVACDLSRAWNPSPIWVPIGDSFEDVSPAGCDPADSCGRPLVRSGNLPNNELVVSRADVPFLDSDVAHRLRFTRVVQGLGDKCQCRTVFQHPPTTGLAHGMGTQTQPQ